MRIIGRTEVIWRNNSLSIVTLSLFVVALAGQSVAGWKAHNEEMREHRRPTVSYTEFVTGNDFGETVFENWESEFLQMSVYVLLTVFLYQKGSSESKSTRGGDPTEEDPRKHRRDRDAPGPVRRGGWRLALYRNSLSLVLIVLFLGSMLGHAAAGARRYNDDRAAHGAAGDVGAFEYMLTPRFWYESLQNWQSEFLAVLAIVVLSIWLRQWGSPESKPVHAPSGETGH